MKRLAVAALAMALVIPNFTVTSTTAYAAKKVSRTAASADGALALLPESSAFVTVNVAQLLRNVQAYLSEKPELATRLQRELDSIAGATGINVAAIDQVAISLPLEAGASASQPTVIISGKFNRDEVLASVTKKSGGKWKGKNYNGERIYLEPKNSRSKVRGALAFFEDAGMLAFGDQTGLRRVIDVHQGAATAVAQDAALMASFHQASPNASIRFALTVPEAIRQRLASGEGMGTLLRPLAAVSQIVGSADLTEAGFLGAATLQTGSDREAADVANLITTGLAFIRMLGGGNPDLAPFLGLLNGITYAQAGSAVNVTVNVPADLIRQIIDGVRSRRS